MKNTLKIAFTSITLLSSAASFAASESQLLGECKTFAKAQFENIESIKSSSIKSRKNRFEAKFKIRTADDKGLFLCTIERDSAPQLARLDKGSEQIAAKR